MKGLDKWLTTPPDDGYSNWCEAVIDLISDEEITPDEYEQNEDWIEAVIDYYSRVIPKEEDYPDPKTVANLVKIQFGRLRKGTWNCPDGLMALYPDIHDKYNQIW